MLKPSYAAHAKPFIKWVGGKGQLISQLESLMPDDFKKWGNVTYIEPFVGGGAMLFHMLRRHHNITRAIINDINPDLTACYRTVRDNPLGLIDMLSQIQSEYRVLKEYEKQKEYYLKQRDRFNEKGHDDLMCAALFIFLNRTCFNGLYRVNKRGLFNVPFGRYENPLIADKETILADSELLCKVEILTGDFTATLEHAQSPAFFYFDPPYRPLSATSSFNDYAKEAFDDEQQIRLKRFCDEVEQHGFHFLLSNSDCSGHNPDDLFFDNLFADYTIDRVWAKRSVNSNGSKRGRLTEIAVHNYTNIATEMTLPI